MRRLLYDAPLGREYETLMGLMRLGAMTLKTTSWLYMQLVWHCGLRLERRARDGGSAIAPCVELIDFTPGRWNASS